MPNRSNGGWWRDYQRSLRRGRGKGLTPDRLSFFLVCAGGVFALLAVALLCGSLISQWRSGPQDEGKKTPPAGKPDRTAWEGIIRTREDLWPILKDFDPLLYAGESGRVVHFEGKPLTVKTGLDAAIQSAVAALLKKSQTIKAAAVVMDPFSGRILALAGYDANGGGNEVCLQAGFPAASLFKIVSAAAAIEVAGLMPESPLYYNGGRYTLYKSQLNDKRSRYTHEVPLKEAFGLSINPVFGKLGSFTLGQDVLNDYAGRFMFNYPIPFDLPLEESRIEVPETAFGLAEIASGFNKRTLISPLHGALFSSAVANGGVMMVPWLVKEVKDESGRTLYRVEPAVMARPIEAATARKLRVLMQETVKGGTCRRTIRRLTRKKPFDAMEIGAKTGTINDPTNTHKVDWLSAYVIDPDRKEGVCIAVMGMHGEKLGIRAPDMGRLILDECIF